MGYYTRFSLDIEETGTSCSATPEQVAEITKAFDFCTYGAEILEEILSRGSDEIKWYSHDDDFKKLSSLFPNFTFVLDGDGEEQGDVWQKEYRNGQMRKAEQICTMGPFSDWS